MSTILVFGDSMAYGAWDIEGGWVQRLRKFLDKKSIRNLPYFTLIYNLSISGNTTDNLIRRFDKEIKIYLRNQKARVIIFSIGTNDSRRINEKYAVELGRFKKNIRDLIKKAKKHTSKIVFVGPIPIYPSVVRWSSTEIYRMEDISKYNDIMNFICKENSIHFINMFNELTKIKYSRLLQDELHYNTRGHQKIFKIVKDYLVKNKIV